MGIQFFEISGNDKIAIISHLFVQFQPYIYIYLLFFFFFGNVTRGFSVTTVYYKRYSYNSYKFEHALGRLSMQVQNLREIPLCLWHGSTVDTLSVEKFMPHKTLECCNSTRAWKPLGFVLW
jgi:hypothetical protein